jgi:hypothetical protein
MFMFSALKTSINPLEFQIGPALKRFSRDSPSCFLSSWPIREPVAPKILVISSDRKWQHEQYQLPFRLVVLIQQGV